MIYDYEERKMSDKFDYDSNKASQGGKVSNPNLDFELTDVAGGKTTQTGFYK